MVMTLRMYGWVNLLDSISYYYCNGYDFTVINRLDSAYPVVLITGGCQMTTSPYDNLPVSRRGSADRAAEHIPRFRNMHDSSEDSGMTFSNAGDAVMQPADKDMTDTPVHQDTHTRTGYTSSASFSSMQNQGYDPPDVEGNVPVQNRESSTTSEPQQLAHDMKDPIQQAAGVDLDYRSLTDDDSSSEGIDNLTYIEVDPEEYENTADSYGSAIPAAASDEPHAEILHDGMDATALSANKVAAPDPMSAPGNDHHPESSPGRKTAVGSARTASDPGTAAASGHSSSAGSESGAVPDSEFISDLGIGPGSKYAAASGHKSDSDSDSASGHTSGCGSALDHKSGSGSDPASSDASVSANVPAPAIGSAASSFSGTSPHGTNTMQDRSIEQHIPMENAPGSDRLTVKNMIGTSETTIESEETLLVPDTMPDIERILFSECTVSTSKPQGSRYSSDDTVSGTITIYTVYKPAPPSDTPIDVIRSSIPFKASKPYRSNTSNNPNTSSSPGAGSEATYFIPVVKAGSCTSDMINERKFTAKITLLLRCSEIAEKELPILRNSDDEDLETLIRTIAVSSLAFETEDRTEISQEINIRDGSPAPKKILSAVINITENHKQITSGKLVINATIHTKVLYAGESDGETTICKLSGKTDFTQFTAMDRECSCENITTIFDSSNLTITIADDDRFLLEGHVLTFIRGCETKELPMICDAYHKKRDIIFDRNEQILYAASNTVSGEISSREIIDPEETSRKPHRLIYGSCRPASLTATPEKKRIIIEGSVHTVILALDSTGEPFIIQRDIPMRGALEMSTQPPIQSETFTTEATTADITSDIRSFWFDEINNRQLEINVTINVNISINIPVTFISMQNFAFAETNPAGNHVTMALYITGNGDTLWDVAKRYRTDIASIAETNNISEEQPLPTGTKLLIVK